MKLKICNATLNYREGLTEASAPPGTGAAAKYSAHLILENDTRIFLVGADGVQKPVTIDEAIETVAKQKLGANWKALYAAMAADKKSVRDGNSHTTAEGYVREAYKDRRYISAKNLLPPTLLDNVLDPQTGKARILPRNSPRLYAGARVNATIDLYVVPTGSKRSMPATLMGVQFCADGERISGGGVSSPDDFDAVVDTSAADGLIGTDESGESLM